MGSFGSVFPICLVCTNNQKTTWSLLNCQMFLVSYFNFIAIWSNHINQPRLEPLSDLLGGSNGLQVEEMELCLAEDGKSLVVPYFGDRVPWHQLDPRSVYVCSQPKRALFRWFKQRCSKTERFMLAIVKDVKGTDYPLSAVV